MIKKITRRYNKKLKNEFKKFPHDIFEDFKLFYTSGTNSKLKHRKKNSIQLAKSFDGNPNRWKKYAKLTSINFVKK